MKVLFTCRDKSHVPPFVNQVMPIPRKGDLLYEGGKDEAYRVFDVEYQFSNGTLVFVIVTLTLPYIR